MVKKKMRELLYWLGALIILAFNTPVSAKDDVNMNEVRELAKLPVDNILEKAPVSVFAIDTYWRNVHGRNKPLVVFFYVNQDGPSQRLATLIRYIAPDYSDKLSFGRVKVIEKGKPDKTIARKLASAYSLDSTPGILFYDNVGSDMVLEDEDYIDADFKEFRTPKLFLWKTYYAAVRKELDKLLAD